MQIIRHFVFVKKVDTMIVKSFVLKPRIISQVVNAQDVEKAKEVLS